MKVHINTVANGKIVVETVCKIVEFPTYVYFHVREPNKGIAKLYEIWHKNGVPRSEVIDLFIEKV